MNCAQFEELVYDLDRPGTAGFDSRDAAFTHAESCDRCTELLTQSEALDFALHEISHQASREQAPARIEAALLNEFHRRNVASSRGLRGWYVAALGTAAALLLALGLAVLHRTTRRSQTNVVQRAAGVAAKDVAKTAGDVAASSGSGSRADATDNASVDDLESSTAFVPLPYADTSTMGDGGAIVRVVLSRSAIASFGLPVTDLSATDRIPADIVLSEDGAPQAIRLVAQSGLDE